MILTTDNDGDQLSIILDTSMSTLHMLWYWQKITRKVNIFYLSILEKQTSILKNDHDMHIVF